MLNDSEKEAMCRLRRQPGSATPAGAGDRHGRIARGAARGRVLALGLRTTRFSAVTTTHKIHIRADAYSINRRDGAKGDLLNAINPAANYEFFNGYRDSRFIEFLSAE